jgi:hypothetical protein
MGTTLDGQAVFDEQDLAIAVGSPSRASLTRTVAGLDGVASIDLGRRTRQIRQTGVLRAASRSALLARVSAIVTFIDGRTHTLTAPDGQTYGNLRMDAFTQIGECAGGAGTSIRYEIVYTQLGD